MRVESRYFQRRSGQFPLSAIAAHGNHEIGAARMPSLQACMKREAGPRGSGFESHGVTENAFNAGDVWR